MNPSDLNNSAHAPEALRPAVPVLNSYHLLATPAGPLPYCVLKASRERVVLVPLTVAEQHEFSARLRVAQREHVRAVAWWNTALAVRQAVEAAIGDGLWRSAHDLAAGIALSQPRGLLARWLAPRRSDG